MTRTVPLSPDLEIRVESCSAAQGAQVDVRLYRRAPHEQAPAAFIPFGGFRLPLAQAAELGAALIAEAKRAATELAWAPLPHPGTTDAP